MGAKGELEATAKGHGGNRGDGGDFEASEFFEGGAEVQEELFCPGMAISVNFGGEASWRAERETHSRWVILARSLRSAPAQNAASTLLDSTTALVGPLPSSAAMVFTCLERVSRRLREIALRALGRFSCSKRTWPDPGAGICWVKMISSSAALVLSRDTNTLVEMTVETAGRVIWEKGVRRIRRGDMMEAIAWVNLMDRAILDRTQAGC